MAIINIPSDKLSRFVLHLEDVEYVILHDIIQKTLTAYSVWDGSSASLTCLTELHPDNSRWFTKLCQTKEKIWSAA